MLVELWPSALEMVNIGTLRLLATLAKLWRRPWSEMDGRAFSSTKAATRRPRPFGSHGFPCSVTAT